MTALRLTLVLGAASYLAACSSAQTRSIVETPMAPPLASAPLNVNTQGAIYQAGAPLLLYETPRAQHVGDVLTIRLSESYSGNNSASASANRTSSITATAADQSTNAAARLAKLFNIGSASTDYKGQGNLSDISNMTGTLAVTVIGTVSGGNLVVSGEKVIAMSGTRDRLRLSGIVNPKDIEAGNYVASSKVANARIEQAGLGMVNDATTMGWLQRMFLSVLTF
ncbi:flagellar basal body L-ring protein FlgH [Paraburkholderia sp. MM5384-R2]|uniref:flagellar basal body L-ring protein FlgH n=1 Tax=Paraburkholderia sp. MM5384-R2 TaxID=2723097 RepID=UPI00160AA0B2|nr:flagellar basal body L-ring protein FlgH [Paraburkholderia sp. MM5384-R2]MBB5500998.1 flagellar L-ring protein precursor FlgH [Paraburkholderia sp. MM5384-R2]